MREEDEMKLPPPGVSKQVHADPRVIAARLAFDAFKGSEAGQALDEAYTGKEWRTKAAALDEEIKNRYEAHAENYYHTRRLVADELIAAIEATEQCVVTNPGMWPDNHNEDLT